MSKSLNEYAIRVAHIIGQPNNSFIRERIKDSIKDYFAKYIIQSIDKNGIQDFYKISLKIELETIGDNKIQYTNNGVTTDIFIDYTSKTKLPTPLNIKNDAPFTGVYDISNGVYSYKSLAGMRMASTLAPTWGLRAYTLKDGYLIVKLNSIRINELLAITSPKVITTLEEVYADGLWENPEEVIGYYLEDDNQDLPLPFPNEMMNFVLADMLKTEYNIKPEGIELETH